LSAKRAILTDAKFEKLMLMKGNHHQVETMQKEPYIMNGLVMPLE